MSRRPARNTEAEIARAVRVAQKCGAGAVEIKPDGTIRVVIAPKESAVPATGLPELGLEPDDKVVL